MIYSILSILLALMPALFLVLFIIGKDKKSPEPPIQLGKAFLYGVVSVLLALGIVEIIQLFVHYGEDSVAGQLGCAFWGAALPEELAKYFMLWLLLRNNKFFDERLDGIVYAAMVGLGFAAFENVMYMINYYSEWMSLGVTRALMTVPAHYAFAVFMGYYYSLGCFAPRHHVRNFILALVVPILMHTLYDALLMVAQITSEFLAVILTIVCILLCYLMHKEAFRRLNKHMQADSIIVPDDVKSVPTYSDDEIEYVEYKERKNR